MFNKHAPFVFAGAAILLGISYFSLKNKKLLVEDDGISIEGKVKIPYSSIEKINKTHFKSKGFFTIAYKDESGREKVKKLGDRRYDNLAEVLEAIVAKIS